MANNDTKIISEKDIYQAKYFRVFERVIERNGKIFTKDMLARASTVHILPITEDNEIYMVSQYRDALEEVTLEVAAGHIGEKEDPLEGAKRELAEETGLTAKHWEHLITYHQGANFSGEVHIYVAKELEEGSTAFDEDEDIEVVKLPVEEAMKKTLTGGISIANQIATLHLYNAKKGTKNG